MAKAPKKAPKKTKKKSSAGAPSAALAAARENHKREREHVGSKLQHAHKAVLAIVDRVHADDREGIAKVRRAVEHADQNAQSRGKGA